MMCNEHTDECRGCYNGIGLRLCGRVFGECSEGKRNRKSAQVEVDVAYMSSWIMTDSSNV